MRAACARSDCLKKLHIASPRAKDSSSVVHVDQLTARLNGFLKGASNLFPGARDRFNLPYEQGARCVVLETESAMSRDGRELRRIWRKPQPRRKLPEGESTVREHCLPQVTTAPGHQLYRLGCMDS